MRKAGRAIVALGLSLALTAPGLAACESKKTEKRKIRQQPIWSITTSPKQKKRKPRITISPPKKTPSCSPGDKRWVCPR
jgi:hypothetical protein